MEPLRRAKRHGMRRFSGASISCREQFGNGKARKRFIGVPGRGRTLPVRLPAQTQG
jgi:hypothetical protein